MYSYTKLNSLAWRKLKGKSVRRDLFDYASALEHGDCISMQEFDTFNEKIIKRRKDKVERVLVTLHGCFPKCTYEGFYDEDTGQSHIYRLT